MSKGKKIVLIVLIILAVLTASLFLGAIYLFDVPAENIVYTGNTQYTAEELTEKIFGSNPNTLKYYLFGKQAEIPFVQKYEVSIGWPHKFEVTVYEKAVVGYINYMGSNMYFDKDGFVVESSPSRVRGIPQVTGIDFKTIVLNSKLSVENEAVFGKVLELTQLFDKNKIDIDKIYFDKDLNATLYYGDVKIILGDDSELAEKIHCVKEMSEDLKRLKGTLHMEEYSENSPNVILKKEK